MRQFITAAALLGLCLSLHGQAKLPAAFDSPRFRIDESAVSNAFPVSFSIGYPKDWIVTEGRPPGSSAQPADSALICTFDSNVVPTDWAQIQIWRTGGTDARGGAMDYANVARQRTGFLLKEFTAIKTKAGEPGYLVVFSADFGKKSVVLSDFFFHAGERGSIRVSILTRIKDTAQREKLQKLVLDTLRF